MTFLKNVVSLAAVAAMSSAQAAPTVTVSFADSIFGTLGYDLVDRTYTDASSTGTASPQATTVGRFQGVASNLQGVSPSLFVDGVGNVLMYCYEVNQDIYSGAVVKYTVNLDGGQARTLDFLGAVNTVLQGTGAYDPYAWLHPVTTGQAAAIQVGIWESLYDNTWDLASGALQITGLDAGTVKWWNTFTNAVDSSASLDGQYVMTLTSPGLQDMITGNAQIDLPEPASLALVALGLVGLAASRRRAR